MILLNDTHLGVARQTGTTPESRKALEDAQFTAFESQMPKNENLMLVGDLFDKTIVSSDILWRTFGILSTFLATTKKTLWLVRGNHDASNIKGQMCSLDLLVNFLSRFHPDQVSYITEPYNLNDEVKVIPHLPNQDLFDLEIDKADKEGIHTLILHCNYDNFFATQADHSLNITKEQASKFGTIILGHEHTPKDITNGETKVHILGCQYPTSIADCKNAFDLTSTIYTLSTGALERIDVLDINEVYWDIDWQELDKQEYKFIRVSGNATAEQAGKATQAVSKFRKKSDAFVITTSIEIEGMTSEEDLEEATEEISNLNIVSMLFENLKAWEVSAIKKMQADKTVDLVEEAKC